MSTGIDDAKVVAQAETAQDAPLDQEAIKIIERTTSQVAEPEVKEQAEPAQDLTTGESEQQLPTLEIYEDELPKLQELGYDQKDFDSGELTREDIDNILATNTKKETAPVEQAKSEVIITPEIAEQYGGIAKSFVGKPLGELFKAIQANNSHISKLTTELKKHETLLTENEKSKVDKLEEELKNPKSEFTEEQFWEKTNELIEMKAEIKARSLAPDPDAGKKEAEFYEVAQTFMPEGVKFQDVSEEWWSQLSPQEQSGYTVFQKEKPTEAMQIMVNAIKTFAQLKVKDSTIKTKEKELTDAEKDKDRQIRLAAAKKAREAIKNSEGQHVQGSRVNIVPRKIEKSDYGDDVVNKIMKRHEE